MNRMVQNAFLAGAIAISALHCLPAVAQEYVLPQEEAEKRKPKPDPDTVQAIELPSGKLEVFRIPVEHLTRAVVITSHPEVADVHVEEPGMMFVFARTPGTTVIVIADKDKTPIYTSKVTVVLPDDQGG